MLTEVVTLSIPVQSDLLVLVRLTAAAVASKVGFDVVSVEDFRLAAYELCLSCIASHTQGLLEVQFEIMENSVSVRSKFETQLNEDPGVHAQAEIDRLSIQIIGALVDDYHFHVEDGITSAWLTKRVGAIA